MKALLAAPNIAVNAAPRGCTPLTIARALGRDEVVALLEARGGKAHSLPDCAIV